MPGTVQGLKDRLLCAIDDTGNVRQLYRHLKNYKRVT